MTVVVVAIICVFDGIVVIGVVDSVVIVGVVGGVEVVGVVECDGIYIWDIICYSAIRI